MFFTLVRSFHEFYWFLMSGFGRRTRYYCWKTVESFGLSACGILSSLLVNLERSCAAVRYFEFGAVVSLGETFVLWAVFSQTVGIISGLFGLWSPVDVVQSASTLA